MEQVDTARHGKKVAEFPVIVRPLVALHGAEKVLTAGMLALGYPATWVTEFSELIKLK